MEAMIENQGLKFIYSSHSFPKEKPDYWDGIATALKSQFPSISFENYSGQRGEEGIFVYSIDEALDGNLATPTRGVIISFIGGIEEEQIKNIRKIFDKSLLGFIDISQPALLHVPWFKRIANESKILGTGAEKGIGQVHMGKVLEQSLKELQRVKRIHEGLVPLRHEKVKNINVFSKFAAGYASGGEFFDLIKDDGKVVILVSHTNSYVSSSIILNHFEELQKSKEKNKECLEIFLENLIDECRELDLIDRDNPDTFQLDILSLDLKRFKYEGFHFGKAGYFSNGVKISKENSFALNENSFEETYYEGTLQRGERFVYISPGVLANFKERSSEDLLDKIIKEQIINGPRELLNEIFFQLKKNNKDEFLKYDASVIYLEVDENAFIQV